MPLLPTLRIVAVIEATSFLLLLVATGIKYGADQPIGVQVLGPIHGILFVAYVVLALALWRERGWRLKTGLLVLIGAVLPFGGFVVDRAILRDEPVAAPGHSGG